MSRKYVFNQSGMEQVKQKLEQIQEILEQSCKAGEQVKNQIDDKKNWSGEAQKSMASFMDLLLQFHRDLANKKEPVIEAADSVGEFLDHMSNYTAEWPEWNELEGIS